MGHEGRIIDNTTDAEVDALINAYLRLEPTLIQVYTIDRPTPETSLERVPADELQRIARRIEAEGLTVQVNA